MIDRFHDAIPGQTLGAYCRQTRGRTGYTHVVEWVAPIERLTKTLAICNGRRFRRDTGLEHPKQTRWPQHHLAVATDRRLYGQPLQTYREEVCAAWTTRIRTTHTLAELKVIGDFLGVEIPNVLTKPPKMPKP